MKCSYSCSLWGEGDVTFMEKIYPYAKGDGTVQWVSTDWLSGHLNDKNLMILDCQPNIHEVHPGPHSRICVLARGIISHS